MSDKAEGISIKDKIKRDKFSIGISAKKPGSVKADPVEGSAGSQESVKIDPKSKESSSSKKAQTPQPKKKKKKKKHKRTLTPLQRRMKEYSKSLKKDAIKHHMLKQKAKKSIADQTSGALSREERQKLYKKQSGMEAKNKFKQIKEEREAQKVKLDENHWKLDRELLKKAKLKNVLSMIGLNIDADGNEVDPEQQEADKEADVFKLQTVLSNDPNVESKENFLNLNNIHAFMKLKKKNRLDLFEKIINKIVELDIEYFSMCNSNINYEFVSRFMDMLETKNNKLIYVNFDSNDFDLHCYNRIAEFMKRPKSSLRFLSFVNQKRHVIPSEVVETLLKNLEKSTNTHLEKLGFDIRLINHRDLHNRVMQHNISVNRKKGMKAIALPGNKEIADGPRPEKVKYGVVEEYTIEKRGPMSDHVYSEDHYVANVDWEKKNAEMKREAELRKANYVKEKTWRDSGEAMAFKFQISGNESSNKCPICGKTAYLVESFDIGIKFHKRCFRCFRCRSRLTPSKYAKTEDGIFCVQCFKSLFLSAGGKYQNFNGDSTKSQNSQSANKPAPRPLPKYLQKNVTKSAELSMKELHAWIGTMFSDALTFCIENGMDEEKGILEQYYCTDKKKKRSIDYQKKYWLTDLVPWIVLISTLVDAERVKQIKKANKLKKKSNKELMKRANPNMALFQKLEEIPTPEDLMKERMNAVKYYSTYQGNDAEQVKLQCLSQLIGDLEDMLFTVSLTAEGYSSWDARAVRIQLVDLKKGPVKRDTVGIKSIAGKGKSNAFLTGKIKSTKKLQQVGIGKVDTDWLGKNRNYKPVVGKVVEESKADVSIKKTKAEKEKKRLKKKKKNLKGLWEKKTQKAQSEIDQMKNFEERKKKKIAEQASAAPAEMDHSATLSKLRKTKKKRRPARSRKKKVHVFEDVDLEEAPVTKPEVQAQPKGDVFQCGKCFNTVDELSFHCLLGGTGEILEDTRVCYACMQMTLVIPQKSDIVVKAQKKPVVQKTEPVVEDSPVQKSSPVESIVHSEPAKKAEPKKKKKKRSSARRSRRSQRKNKHQQQKGDVFQCGQCLKTVDELSFHCLLGGTGEVIEDTRVCYACMHKTPSLEKKDKDQKSTDAQANAPIMQNAVAQESSPVVDTEAVVHSEPAKKSEPKKKKKKRSSARRSRRSQRKNKHQQQKGDVFQCGQCLKTVDELSFHCLLGGDGLAEDIRVCHKCNETS